MSQSVPAVAFVSITNCSDSAGYPISSFTWLLVPEHIQDPEKRQAIGRVQKAVHRIQ
jgi:phosphate transport system substrate-binding protein